MTRYRYPAMDELVDFVLAYGRESDLLGNSFIDDTREKLIMEEGLKLADPEIDPVIAIVATWNKDRDDYAIIPATTADGDKLWGVWWLYSCTKLWVGYKSVIDGD